MKASLESKRLEVRQSTVHGFGVFALEDIDEGETIEECYIVYTTQECPQLFNHYFCVEKKIIIAFGYGSIYNHANFPNADYNVLVDQPVMFFTATKPIKQGEEIFIYYGPQWFKKRYMHYVDPAGLKNKRYLANMFTQAARFLVVIGLLFLILNFLI